MPGFPDAYAVVLAHEIGKVDNPADYGGRTKDGVTQNTYAAFRRAHGASVRDVYLMTDAERQAIYLQYWNASGAASLPWPLALVHFDSFINHSPSTARSFLTAAAGDTTRYLDTREAYFRQRVARVPSQSVFLRGWLNRVNDLRQRVASVIRATTAAAKGSGVTGQRGRALPSAVAGAGIAGLALAALLALLYFRMFRR